MMRIIIEHQDNWPLQVRAALSAFKDGIAEGELWGVSFSDGSTYGVKRSKRSVRVYPHKPCEAEAAINEAMERPDFGATGGIV